MANIKAVTRVGLESNELYVVEYEKSVKYYEDGAVPMTVMDFIIENAMSVKVRETYVKWTKI